ncbi:MAG: hypothetical protein PHN56_05165 [Candidatus Nanoarchaeia archaeon]|nr:hypothetical protein [Candidatus Nanoarchaeia archaeon]
MNLNKGNFFLIFFIILMSFEFLALISFVISKQVWINNLELNDYKFFMLEIITFGFISYYWVGKKK